MLITVTQVLPSGKTQWRELNTDLVMGVRPDIKTGHIMVQIESGFEIETTLTSKEEWDKLVAGS